MAQHEEKLTEREQTLSQREAGLEAREVELATQQTRVAARETAVAAREAATETREKSLDVQGQEVKERAAQIAKQEQSLTERQQSAQAREQDDSTVQAELTGLREQLAAQSATIAELTEACGKLEANLAAQSQAAQQTNVEQPSVAELQAESDRKVKSLEANVRSIEQRHKDLQRECEVLRRRLQAALKSPAVDANGTELAAAAASATQAVPGSAAEASSKSEAQSAPSTGPTERSLQQVISQFESSLFTRRPRERAASHESTDVAAGGATAAHDAATHNAGTHNAGSHESAASHAPVASRTSQSQPAAASSGSPATPAAHHGHESESVEAYMQKLLARSRRSATPDAPWTAAAPQTTTLEPRAAEPTPAAPQLATPAQLPLPEPSHRQDKASVRADLDSLRNVANSAARSAIATYSSRAVREKLLYRSLLATLSLLITVVLLSSSLWGDGSYMAMGWLAAAASLALGVDLARASGKVGLSRIKHATVRSRTLARLVEKTTDNNAGEEQGK